MKICKDCKHARIAAYEVYECASLETNKEMTVTTDLVTGKVTGRILCRTARQKPCGPEGKFYEDA